MKYTERDLKEHLAKEHRTLSLGEHLREIVYGGVDGIVTTFAVVVGFAGATGGNHFPDVGIVAVLLFGMANLFADGVSMGLGNLLSARSDQDVYRAQKEKEKKEIEENPDLEEAETIHILRKRGFSEEEARQMAGLYRKNEKYWLEFMMKQELSMDNSEGEKPIVSALVTFASFLAFGFIPLLPYFVLRTVDNTFVISVSFTLLALLLLGFLRFKVTKEELVRSVGEVILIGGASAMVAFVVGMFFRG